MTAWLSADGAILHIHIPMKLRRRGGKKVIITPDGVTPGPGSAQAVTEDPLVRALVKARRWQTMLEAGEAATIKDLAAKEGVDRTYMARLLKLNILSPAIVERVLTGDYPESVNLETLRLGIPLDWADQAELFGVG
ncbi:MAG: hypothetical protein HQL87_08515 [Magnetococcales bacterium]|nr:hypothetical protein [Magnetococcales bacterium]